MSRRLRDEDFSSERVPVTTNRRLRTTDVARTLRRASTPSEQALWDQLRDRRLNGYRFRRQQPIGPYIVDFFCAADRLVVEIDGAIHETQQEYDAERQREIESAGYRFLRLRADQVLHDLPSALNEIVNTLANAPPLPRQGEGAGG